jgi:predicted nucleotidyltransferase
VDSRKPSIPEAYRKALSFLEEQKVPYVVVGGLAAAFQGEPRATNDVDFMVTVDTARVWRLAEEAQRAGFDVDPHLADLHWRMNGFVRLWLGPPGEQVAVDLMACATEFLREAAWRAQQALLMGRRVPIASPEDLILFKLAAYRDKDVPDITAIFQRHEAEVDREYLRKWATWFAARNSCFQEVPARLEILLAKGPMPAGKPSRPWG